MQIFSRDPTNATLRAYVDTDGLPIVGRQYKEGEPYLCILDIDQGKFVVKVKTYNGEVVCKALSAEIQKC